MDETDDSPELSERFRMLVENSRDCIWCLDATTGRFTYISPSITLLRGLTVQEAMAERMEDSLTPESLERSRAILSKAIPRFLSGEPRIPQEEMGEYRQYRKDGSIVDVEISTTLARNRITGALEVMGVSRDISERKAIEAAMAEEVRQKDESNRKLVGEIAERALAESLLREKTAMVDLAIKVADVGLWVLDFKDTSVQPDERMFSLYEVDEDVRRTGKYLEAWRAALHPEDAPGTIARFNAAIDNRTSYEDEYRIVLKGGRTMHIQSAATLEKDGNGTAMRMIGIHRDITTQRELEAGLKAANAELTRNRDHLEEIVTARTRELAAARDDAEAANRAKSAFLSTMSHEMRTPLAQIVGLCQLVAMGSPDPKAKARLADVDKAARHLLGLIDNILDYTSAEGGRLSIQELNFSLESTLGEVIGRFRTEAASKGLELALEIDRGLPDALAGDPVRVAQVLGALVDNAVKYSHQGRVTVRVSEVGRTAVDVQVRFSVEDQGIGIAPEMQARVFVLFSQVDGSHSRRYEGIGLGLSLSRRLVRLMAGEMGYASVEGKGSTFWFKLPLRIAIA